jgi:hypothetical protein
VRGGCSTRGIDDKDKILGKGKGKGKDKVVPVLKLAPRYEGALGD